MSGKEQNNILLFNKWDTSEISILDEGLKNVILIKPYMTIPITFGRHEHQRLKKSEVHIIERLANKLMHFGKRYANTGAISTYVVFAFIQNELPKPRAILSFRGLWSLLSDVDWVCC